MSAFAAQPGGSRVALRQSGPSQTRQPQPGHNDTTRLPAPHDGLPKPYLAPFHRSSSPSVVGRDGKENVSSYQHRDPRSSQPPMNILRNQRSGNVSDMARNEEERRNQAAWSPRRGRREDAPDGTSSVANARGFLQPPHGGARMSTDTEDVNRDFERLLDKFQLSATVRSRLTPLDTPLKKSLLCSPLALNSLIGGNIPGNGSPSRPALGTHRAQSTLPSESIPASPQNRRTKSSQATVQDARQVRKMQSGASLRAVESGSPRSAYSATAGRKTEYVDNAKFVVLNGSPSRTSGATKQAGAVVGNGKRTSYHHTQDGIPVPPPLPYLDASPDLRDNEYDFMHDFSRPSTAGEPFHGPHRSDYTNTVGSSSSNSSAGSRAHDDKLQTTRQKRSSMFSAKTKSSKKNGYATGDESRMLSGDGTEKTSKEKKRKSYTFGHSFSKAKSLAGESEHLPLPVDSTKQPMPRGQMELGDLPLALAGFLRDAKTFEMDVDKVKRLRLLLGSESTSWIEAFIAAGGYSHLLARLQDLLDVEWRSEQHDDQLFFEILRCIKGLSTSEPGKAAIISQGVTPFRQLVDLLYSEKKPGEVPPKQLIVDLVFSLFDLYRQPGMTCSPALLQGSSPLPHNMQGAQERPNSALLPLHPSSPRSKMQPATTSTARADIPDGYNYISEFILSLLREPPTVVKKTTDDRKDGKANRKSRIIAPASELPAPKLEMHDFIAAAHKPRIFQTYLKELSQTCWDFFWIMHYSKNGIWQFTDVDTETIKPKAPNGASGGVEYEAMRYLTSHFRLINTLARTLFEQDISDEYIRQDMKKGQACQFHADMMFSGMDRILCTVRKASTDLYPEFHLELARYLKLASEAEFELPHVIKALVTPPPDQYCRIGSGNERQFQARPSRQHGSRPHAMYVQNSPLTANDARGSAQPTSWLPAPADIGEFDFQL